MKRNATLLFSVLFVLAIVMVSCKKDSNSSVSFSMKAAEADAPPRLADVPSIGPVHDNVLPLEWNTAWIYITKLDFTAEYFNFTDAQGEVKYPDVHIEWQGNEKVDLMSEPKMFANIVIPDGRLKNFNLIMTSSRFGYMNEPNFYMSGTYGPAFGGTPISVSVTQQFDMNYTYNGEEWINTSDGTLFEGLLQMSLSSVFNGITATDLDNAEITDGWILISSEHNQDLYTIILANLNAAQQNSNIWQLHPLS